MHEQCRHLIAFVAISLIALIAKPAHPQDSISISADRTWTFDDIVSESLLQRGGQVRQAAGVEGKSIVFDGRALLEMENSDKLIDSTRPFTLVVWFNPYQLGHGQQMIVAKNRYSLGEREWGVMVDRDQKLRLYIHQNSVQQNGWKTVQADAALRPGNWHQAGLVFHANKAQLWLNGQLAEEVKLSGRIPQTNAPLTFGGVNDNGRIWQNFLGAVDEARLFSRALTATEMASLYSPINATHSIPETAKPVSLWDESQPLPVAAEIPDLKDISFRVIKKWNQQTDGYTFLHGVGLCWHTGKLYASIGHNKGAENTVTEEAQYLVSEDQGQTWSELLVIDAGEEENLAVSHGVFLSHGGKLWAFHGAYHNKMKNIHTRAYSLDEESSTWIKHGIIIENGFWPMNQPVQMSDGNWVMPGISAGPYSNDSVFPAAVAISHGDDFTNWDNVEISTAAGIDRMWGESALFVDGKQVFNIARYGGGASALVAKSNDFARTWTPSQISNLPMATSKPAAGTLSNGQRFLVCTTAHNNGGKRTPLTIAVTRPGENLFSQVFAIRRSLHPNQPGESADDLSLSYPCAIEHEGHLYVGYSNNGGRRGNLNSAEMAIIPLTALQAK